MTLKTLDDTADEDHYGGKAAQLGAALRADLPVPDGIAVSHELVERLVVEESDRSRLVDRVKSMEGPYVVRSSGVGEDSEQASFAGQHQTVINVPDAAGVLDALELVYESSRSESVFEYRSELGIERPPRMGAVIQKLVDADKAGVLFSRNPVDGSSERVVEASWGLGEAVVDSKVTPDNFRVEPGGEILERRAGTKEIRVVPAADGGTRTESVPDDRRTELCLSTDELRALDALAERCDSAWSGGHDIEWAFADDELYLLQRRSITTS